MVERNASIAQKGEAEKFNDARHRVEFDDGSVFLRRCSKWVGHCGSVHKQLHPKLHQECKVAVLGGQCSDDKTQSKTEHRHKDYEYGEKQDFDAGKRELILEEVVGIHAYEKQELHTKAHEIRHDNAEGHDDAREIYFAKDVGVVFENGGCFEKAIRKIIPSGNAG